MPLTLRNVYLNVNSELGYEACVSECRNLVLLIHNIVDSESTLCFFPFEFVHTWCLVPLVEGKQNRIFKLRLHS